MLKLLSRVTAPTEGKIQINGRIASMLEVGTGFHPELTGRENIYMNGAILGMTKREIDEKIDEIIDFSECRQFIDTPVKRYSSGMYVKLAFAVSAHLDAEILIMDEVLAVGDIQFQKKCLGRMNGAANEEGKTVLFVSHNMNIIRQLCTRCIVLNKGKIIYDGKTEDAIDIYMGISKGELKKKYDLLNEERVNEVLGKKAIVKSLEFLYKKAPVYCCNEKICLGIQIESKEDIEKMRIYFPIKALDDSPVALLETESICDLRKGEEKYIILEFVLPNMVEGQYYFRINPFSMSPLAGHESYDQPKTKMFFELENNNNIDRINFQKKYWGHFRIDNVRIISVTSEL